MGVPRCQKVEVTIAAVSEARLATISVCGDSFEPPSSFGRRSGTADETSELSVPRLPAVPTWQRSHRLPAAESATPRDRAIRAPADSGPPFIAAVKDDGGRGIVNYQL